MRRTPPKEIEIDVQPSAPLDDTQPVAPPADDTPAVIEAAPGVLLEGPPTEVIPEQVVPEQVRIGGSPGVRVVQGGLTQHVRITGNTDAGVADHKPVPLAVLEQVKELLEGRPLALEDSVAAETLRAVRELLGPWL